MPKEMKKSCIVCLTQAWLTIFSFFLLQKSLCLTFKHGTHRRSTNVCMYKHVFFVCLRSATAFFPRGQFPREDLRRSSLPPRPLVTPGPCLTFCSLSPRTFVMHPASGPYPPLSSFPVHITYRVSGLSLPCFPVLHIYSNPTERNPSTHIKPHIQTVLIHYFNKQTINPLSLGLHTGNRLQTETDH